MEVNFPCPTFNIRISKTQSVSPVCRKTVRQLDLYIIGRSFRFSIEEFQKQNGGFPAITCSWSLFVK